MSDHNARIARVFNLVASGYDSSALRFFHTCAEHLVDAAHVQPGQRVLDVATGTGAAAIHAARQEGAQVTGIDIADEMLARARDNVTQAKVQVELRLMDALALEFPDNTFDAVTCAFSIFLMPDESAALREWLRVLKPGGVVAFSVFGGDAFQPLSDLFVRRIQEFGVGFPNPQRPFATQKITTREQCQSLLEQAGYDILTIEQSQHGYFLHSLDEWWELVWGSGFRGPLARLDEAKLEDFKAAHLEDVQDQFAADGLWVNVPAWFAVGHKDEHLSTK